jgi:hypothetical protein
MENRITKDLISIAGLLFCSFRSFEANKSRTEFFGSQFKCMYGVPNKMLTADFEMTAPKSFNRWRTGDLLQSRRLFGKLASIQEFDQ